MVVKSGYSISTTPWQMGNEDIKISSAYVVAKPHRCGYGLSGFASHSSTLGIVKTRHATIMTRFQHADDKQ